MIFKKTNNRNKIAAVLISAAVLTALMAVFIRIHRGRVLEQAYAAGTAVKVDLEIRSTEDYLEFARSVGEGNQYVEQYVQLCTDLDFSDLGEEIIVGVEGSDTGFFAGTFDGGGHTVRNLNLEVPDGAAGMFVGLSGTVSNLNIEGGSVTGRVSGAIAATATNTSYLLNCSSSAVVTGEIAGALAGNFSGKIVNCVGSAATGIETVVGSLEYGNVENCIVCNKGALSLEDYGSEEAGAMEPSEAVSKLNEELVYLDGAYSAGDWFLWKLQDGAPVLTEEPADVPEALEGTIHLGTGQMTLAGYYSVEERAWCFTLPAGYEESEISCRLNFKYGGEESFTKKTEETEVLRAHGETPFTIRFLRTENAASFFISLSMENGLAYLQEDKKNELEGSLRIFDESGAGCYEGALKRMSGRGNDSWNAEKKGYGITLSREENLLDMGTAKNYVLIPGYRDNSLINYKVTEDLAKQVGFAFAPESRMINLYVEGEYLGVYFLTEKIEIGENRFDITNLYEETKQANERELSSYARSCEKDESTGAERIWYDIPENPSDISGGYILELDVADYDEGQSRFVSERGVSLTLKSNRYASKEEVDYIADYWQEFEDALFSENGCNAKGHAYTDYIDVESFVLQWLTYELQTEDSMSGSIYFYKESEVTGDGLLHAAYAWDVEHSYKEESYVTSGWIMNQKMYNVGGYWGQWYQHEDFAGLVLQYWQERYLPAMEALFSEEAVENPQGLSSMRWYMQEYETLGRNNGSRWKKGNLLDKAVTIEEFLKKRTEFLNTALTLYDRGYDYIYEEDGIFYGAVHTDPENYESFEITEW